MEWLELQYELHKEREFLNHLTFGEVYEWVQTVAVKLVGAVSAISAESNILENTVVTKTVGHKHPRFRIGLLWDNSVEMAIYVLALLALKYEIVMINTHLTTEEIERQLAQLGVTIVIASNERAGQVPKAIISSVGSGTGQIKNDGTSKVTILTPDCMVGIDPMKVDLHEPVQDDDIAVIMNTSATTGTFKSVPLRWGQIKAHVAASKQVLGATDTDRWLMVLPLFHVSGFSILMRSLYNGTAVEIMGKYDEIATAKLIESGAVNMVSLVPTILSSLVEHLNEHHMRVILLGGEYIPLELVKVCKEKQLPIYKTYGMTETFSQSVTFSVLDHEDKIDSVGLPLPGMTVSIVNPDSDGVGEIHLRGPMLMSGYIGREPIAGDFNTEDIGFVDKDSYVYILNRRKDLIISGGENIYPKEIEDALYELPFIKECAVVPTTDDTWGQVPALFVVVDQDTSALDTSGTYDTSEIFTFLKNRFATYKVPKYIRVLNELPRNGTGKILRKDLHV